MNGPIRLQNFLQVNHVLRHRNADHLKALALDSRPSSCGRAPLSNYPVPSQTRPSRTDATTCITAKSWTRRIISGSIWRSPPTTRLEAANDGTVVLAEDFGIYGNTVVIDHGYGLQSLYAHLSSINAQKGEDVVKGHVIGNQA